MINITKIKATSTMDNNCKALDTPVDHNYKVMNTPVDNNFNNLEATTMPVEMNIVQYARRLVPSTNKQLGVCYSNKCCPHSLNI